MAERWRHLRGIPEMRLLGVLILLSVILTITTPRFATMQNVMDLVASTAFTGILATGLLVVLVAGGVDISFAAVASITQYIGLTLANHGMVGWTGLIFVCMATGALLGWVNAVLVSTLRLSSIIVTIATQSLFYGLLMSVTKGQDIYALPDWFGNGLQWVLYTDAHGVPQALNFQIIVLVGVLAFTWWMMSRSSVGRQIVAMGGNPEAARRVGFKVFQLNLIVYGFMGTVAGLASLAHAQYVQSVSPSALVGRELDVLAAVVLGGASLNGGIGSVPGTALGVVLLAVLQNGLALLGVSSYWSGLCTGIVILLAVVTMARQHARRKTALTEATA
ncbi:ABC transporter permease [Robbsia sp. Bb-Pol-6]|uniref:ABC transporter permease n=1 Tax=Robbsia betulipollinis TaxID=2981849 RepID=A0ABT3ZIQ7_9BURK|nr:ABC transporter permease [Robbsia betulipollinis]MCY0385863.1 ABC transporter permease [Robbsia betulipollinis]